MRSFATPSRILRLEVKRLTAGQGLAAVYDSVGRDTFHKSMNCLRPRGYLVLYGQASGAVEPLDPQVLNQKGSLFPDAAVFGGIHADA
jgi:NADPH2:quinone reductase